MDKHKKKKLDELGSQPLVERPDGQLCLIPDIPDFVQKARGPVIDSVMAQGLEEQSLMLIDDTYEVSEKPIPIQTKVMLSYEGIEFDIQGRMKLTAFDREVIDAVASLSQNNEVITAAHIYRVMMGKKDYQYVTPRQQELVNKSMMKCAYSKLQIDLTDMCEKGSPIAKRLRKDGLKATYSGTLLAFEVVTLTRGKKSVDCYRVLTEPAIIRYAASLGKVSEFPIDLLDTSINKTERNIVLQSFLLRCIDEMYRGESPCFIDVNRMYSVIDATNDTNQHKARFRDTASTILEDWVKKGYITGYRFHKAGRIIKGFDIILKTSGQPQKLSTSNK